MKSSCRNFDGCILKKENWPCSGDFAHFFVASPNN